MSITQWYGHTWPIVNDSRCNMLTLKDFHITSVTEIWVRVLFVCVAALGMLYHINEPLIKTASSKNSFHGSKGISLLLVGSNFWKRYYVFSPIKFYSCPDTWAAIFAMANLMECWSEGATHTVVPL